MPATPLIKPIQSDKGIFYNFQCAVDDITSTFDHNTKRYVFSHFALLRIPEMGTPETLKTDNKIQFLAPGETTMIKGLISTNNYNLNLAESFENYCLNLEALLLSRADHDFSLRRTVSERVFWKWMKELGAIRFRRANTINERDSNSTQDERYVEEDERADSTYNRVVKYIGEIGAVNSKRGEHSYSEIYVYVPSSVGTTPRIMFDSISDVNYTSEMRIQNLKADPINIEYLAGRKYTDTHPYSLRLDAFYDLDDGSVKTEISTITDPVSAVYVEKNWFDDTSLNAYYTDPLFDVADNLLIRKTHESTVINYLRSSLDGIVLDLDLDNYKLANDTAGVSTFSQFAEISGNDSKNFEFNAILVYYTLIDDTLQDTDPAKYVTNLYGIMFLDKVVNSGVGTDFYIPSVPKYKPDVINKRNGTAFSIKLNVKFDTSMNEAAVEKSINDYNTFSMDMFMDAINSMNTMVDFYNENIYYIKETREEIDKLKGLLVDYTNKNDINKRIDAIESSLLQSQALLADEKQIMSMIYDLYKKYDSILKNETRVDVTYNLDAAAINNIVTKNQEYNLSSGFKEDRVVYRTMRLNKYTNYYQHYKESDVTLAKDLVLYIDDTDEKWQTGQAFMLDFKTIMNLGIYDVKIYTDATGVFSGSEYGQLVASFSSLDFTTSDGKPMFQIICTSSANALAYEVIKIR